MKASIIFSIITTQVLLLSCSVSNPYLRHSPPSNTTSEPPDETPNETPNEDSLIKKYFTKEQLNKYTSEERGIIEDLLQNLVPQHIILKLTTDELNDETKVSNLKKNM